MCAFISTFPIINLQLDLKQTFYTCRILDTFICLQHIDPTPRVQYVYSHTSKSESLIMYGDTLVCLKKTGLHILVSRPVAVVASVSDRKKRKKENVKRMGSCKISFGLTETGSMPKLSQLFAKAQVCISTILYSKILMYIANTYGINENIKF